MKKTLLSIAFCALVSFIAKADESVITFNGGKYEGTSPKIDITDTSFAMDKAYDVPGVGTFTVTNTSAENNDSQVKVAANPHLQFAINNTITLTPASNVTITQVFFKCTTKSYTKEVTASEGSPETDADACTITWTGNATSALSISNNVDDAPIRVMYIEVTYTSGSSAIESVAADSNASVKYYNLNGTEVNAPVKGGVYVQVSGSEAHKIIAE